MAAPPSTLARLSPRTRGATDLEAGRSRSCVGELSECAADRGGKGGDKGLFGDSREESGVHEVQEGVTCSTAFWQNLVTGPSLSGPVNMVHAELEISPIVPV